MMYGHVYLFGQQSPLWSPAVLVPLHHHVINKPGYPGYLSPGQDSLAPTRDPNHS
jgi:hypothetical protein